MTFFNEFGKKWASEGSVEPISEAQKKSGWDFLGSVPPISGQFNLVQQNTDEKINYLFNLINSFVISRGGTLNAVSTNALRDILNNLLMAVQGGHVGYATKDGMLLDTTQEERTIAEVLSDPVAENNGFYLWLSGEWVKQIGPWGLAMSATDASRIAAEEAAADADAAKTEAQTAAGLAVDAQADIHNNWQGKLDIAAQQAGIATNKATEAATSATTAVNAKNAAESARDVAELARDAAIINSTMYPDEATGRAAVADGEYFKVIGSGDVAASEYRRTDASTSVLVAEYPSVESVDAIKDKLVDVYSDTGLAFSVEDKEGNVAFAVLNSGQVVGAGIPKQQDIDVLNESLESVLKEKYKKIIFPEGLISFWDFSSENEPYLSKFGVDSFPLKQGDGSNVIKVQEGPFNSALSFNGASDFLTIPSSEVGSLDLSRFGDECTVVAWVKPATTVAGFVAGCWQEDNNDPRRQYGMFVNLPTYGGPQRVCGHVSYTGRPTPGYPYSRDYSTSAQKLSLNKWSMISFTYDGNKVISYKNAIADEIPVYIDNLGNSYSKNPYNFDEGLNRFNLSEFTVGAVRLTNGMGNFFRGLIGGVAIFNKCLSQTDLMQLRLSTLVENEPLLEFDLFYGTGFSSNPSYLGWRSALGNTGVDTSDVQGNLNFQLGSSGGIYYMTRSGLNSANKNTIGIGYIDSLKSLRLSQLKRFDFTLANSLTTEKIKIIIRINNNWFVSNEEFSVSEVSESAADWSKSENKQFVISRNAGVWKNLIFVSGSTLQIGSEAGNIPNGEVTAIGFLSEGTEGTVRINNIQIFN